MEEGSEKMTDDVNLKDASVEEKKMGTETDGHVDSVLLESLLSMGMGTPIAKKALICTKNISVDAALAWIAELGAEEMDALCDNSNGDNLNLKPASINEKKMSAETVSHTNDHVDPVMLENLLGMGMGKNLSKKALISTKNKSLDAALAWIAELGAEEMEVLCENSDNDSNASDEWEDCDEEEEEIYYKMVFVVNMELSMGVGKVAAQVGHAALGLYRLLMEDKEKYEASTEEWEEFGERKITLKAKNSQELIELRNTAEGLHLPTYLVQDAGKTQVPAGSTTVLAIFGDEEAVNEVTGKLKLL